MPPFPLFTTSVFLATLLFVTVTFVLGLTRAGRPLNDPVTITRRWTLYSTGGLLLWLTLTWGVAASGELRNSEIMKTFATSC